MKPEEFARRLTPEGLKRERERLMQRVVITVEGASKRVTPVDTGTLRRSITSSVERSGERGVVGTNVGYAIYVHDGTRYQRAQPFFEQGLAASRDTIMDLFEQAGATFMEELAR